VVVERKARRKRQLRPHLAAPAGPFGFPQGRLAEVAVLTLFLPDFYAAAMWSLDDLRIQPASAWRKTGVPKNAIEKNRSLSTVPRKNGSPAA
jgi:hypothetical protein